MKQKKELNLTKYLFIGCVFLVIGIVSYIIISDIDRSVTRKNDIAKAEQLLAEMDADRQEFLKQTCDVLEYDFSGTPSKYSCYGTIFTK